MCSTCGCGDETGARVIDLSVDNAHTDNAHTHHHDHEHPHTERTVVLEEQVLAKNNLVAERNRGWLQGRGVRALNLMSSPGSGKTTLLERTIRDLADESITVIEGDQETTFDAERIKATGARVVQVNTGAGCHLDADMIHRALHTLDPRTGSLLFIENVGNLVCPALFDLGEAGRVVIMSVTEGVDKPLKYPHMFTGADVVVLNKIDLLPYVEFEPAEFTHRLSTVNRKAAILPVSATRGEGLTDWYDWIRDHP